MRFENAARTCVFDATPLDDVADVRLGTTLSGRYVIDEVLGEGGMATVYGATHKLTGKSVALKVMHPTLATDAVVRERFRREAKNAQKLTHPNIIEIYDQGETEDGTAYIAMERLHGAPLSATIGSRTMTLRRSSRDSSRWISCLSSSRSSTPVKVPLVIRVWSPSSPQVIPAPFCLPSVTTISNCEGVRPSVRTWRPESCSRAWKQQASSRSMGVKRSSAIFEYSYQ